MRQENSLVRLDMIVTNLLRHQARHQRLCTAMPLLAHGMVVLADLQQ